MLAVFKFQSYLVGNLRFIRLFTLTSEWRNCWSYPIYIYYVSDWTTYVAISNLDNVFMLVSDLDSICLFLIWAIHVFFFWFEQYMCLFLIWAIHVFISDLDNTCVYFWFGQYMCLFLIWTIYMTLSDLDRYQFFLQVKLDIFSGRLPCPQDTLVDLAAEALQCKCSYPGCFTLSPHKVKPFLYNYDKD